MEIIHDWTRTLAMSNPIPAEVKTCGDRLDGGGIWWRPSRNHMSTEAWSCMHAVKFRERLGSGGNGGIPLWAELKSLVGIAIDPTTRSEVAFAAHTRANTQFNERCLLNSLGMQATTARIKKIFEQSTTKSASDADRSEPLHDEGSTLSNQEWFGKVNPFNVDSILSQFTGNSVTLREVTQIFDESLIYDGGIPNTVMSNLGARTIAFEVSPNDLIAVVKHLSPSSFVAPISEPCPIWLGIEGSHLKDYWLQFPPSKGPKIGIITGNSPESGITLWQDMLTTLRRLYPNLPDTLMPEVQIHSIPEMGLSMELASREEEVRAVVREGVVELLGVGCRIVTFACNTTIYYEPEIAQLCKKNKARFVSIAEACMPAIRRALEQHSRGTGVSLVGIGTVVDLTGKFSGYKRHLEAENIRVTPCPADELAFAMKSKGKANKLITEFRNLISTTVPAQDAVVILALTEASMVYRDHIAKSPSNRKSGKTFIDPLVELGRYLSFLYLTQGYRECPVCQIPAEYEIDDKLRNKFGWCSQQPTSL
ncbi:MAG: hypothetical protein ACYC27_22990 [Armatimonadota bacterium]